MRPFVVTNTSGHAPTDIAEPLAMQTTGNHHALVRPFLAKYYGQGFGRAADEPLHTITAKDRFGLITVCIAGTPYFIADIGMRTLTPRELARAQGFLDWYVLEQTADGTPITKIGAGARHRQQRLSAHRVGTGVGKLFPAGISCS